MKISATHYLLGAILCAQVAGFYMLWQQNNGVTAGAVRQHTLPENIAGGDYEERPQIAALVRGILREELANAARQDVAVGDQAPASIERTVDPALNQEAFRKSTAIVDHALAAGKWRQDDNLDIMQLTPNLTSEQRIELLDKISYAINDGTLELEATPPAL